VKLANTWSWVCGRARSSFYSRHELQARASGGASGGYIFGLQLFKIISD